MKKYQKGLLIAAGCLTIAGGIIMVTGLALGGRLGFQISQNGIKTAADKGNFIEKKEVLKDIKNIDISSYDGQITIAQGNELSLEYGYDDSYGIPDYSAKNGNLMYHQNNRAISVYSFGSSNYGMPENYVKLIIPKDTKFSQVTLKTNYGDLNIDTAVIDKLVIRMDSGNINLKNLDLNSLQLVTEYGDLDMENCKVPELNVDNDSGKIQMKSIDGKNVVVNSSYGQVRLLKIAAERLTMSNDSGDITMEDIGGMDKKGNMKEIVMDSDYSECVLRNVKTDMLTIENESGNFNADDLTAVNGNIKLDYATCNLNSVNTSDMQIISESGDVSMSLTGKEKDYIFDIDSEEGRVEINGEKHRRDGTQERAGKKRIKIDTSYANVDLSTNK